MLGNDDGSELNELDAASNVFNEGRAEAISVVRDVKELYEISLDKGMQIGKGPISIGLSLEICTICKNG